MFCILPCATIKDKINLSPVGPAASIIPQMDKIRNQIRKLSDIDYLIDILQKGQVIMLKKVSFDNYLQSHVDLMRSFVSTYTPCNFIYNSFFSNSEINCAGLAQRDQWALEIVLSRLNISSIYHGGSFNNMRVIFMETANSYNLDYKGIAELSKNLQGYQPLKRLLPYFDAIEKLASQQTRQKYIELNKGMFDIFTNIVSCNLVYIKIQKMRLLNQFKSCKEAAYAAYLKIQDIKLKINQLKGKYTNILAQIFDYLNLAETFFEILAYYFLLVQHENQKFKEEYGFIKKQFQLMIYDNLIAIERMQSLFTLFNDFKKQNDNVLYALGILSFIKEETKKFKYRYNINIHQNKMQKPKLEEVVARRIGSSNIWNSLDFY